MRNSVAKPYNIRGLFFAECAILLLYSNIAANTDNANAASIINYISASAGQPVDWITVTGAKFGRTESR
jgi:hypothetical protein